MEVDRCELSKTDGWIEEKRVNWSSLGKENDSRKTTQAGKRNFRIAQHHSHYQSVSILRNRTNLHGNCFTQPPGGFGKGPSILLFTSIIIVTNPPLPPETLIQMDLIEKVSVRTSESLTDATQEEHVVSSAPMEYCLAQREGLKFALRVSKAGDFVPVRLWRHKGV